MQSKRQPGYPLIYSLWGFRYCDLLLAKAERAAWQAACSGGLRPPEAGDAHRATLQAVSQRAAQTLDWWTNHFTNAPLFDIAIDHLTLGRAALYAAILESPSSEFRVPNSELNLAVRDLRGAGYSDHLPSGL